RKNNAGDEEIILDNTMPERTARFPRVLSQEIVEEVISAMKYVTKPGGTSRRADVWGYTEAGKSGTPNKVVNGAYSQTQYVPHFAGFVPVKNAAFVLAVIVDEPEYTLIKDHHGGRSCAPIFRNIATRALEYLGVAPDDPHGYPVGDPRHDPTKADWMPE